MTTTKNTACSCGNTCDHVVARRTTFDGIHVQMHSDGAIVGRMGFKLEGVPVASPRTAEARGASIRAGWLFMGEVEAYDHDDLGALYEACRWAAARDGLPGTVRARLARPRRIAPVWTVVVADRDGHATSRYWRLPRMISPGTVLWDHVSVGASGGRYEIHRVTPGSGQLTCEPTGIRFRTIDAAISFILSEKENAA